MSDDVADDLLEYRRAVRRQRIKRGILILGVGLIFAACAGGWSAHGAWRTRLMLEQEGFEVESVSMAGLCTWSYTAVRRVPMPDGRAHIDSRGGQITYFGCFLY